MGDRQKMKRKRRRRKTKLISGGSKCYAENKNTNNAAWEKCLRLGWKAQTWMMRPGGQVAFRGEKQMQRPEGGKVVEERYGPWCAGMGGSQELKMDKSTGPTNFFNPQVPRNQDSQQHWCAGVAPFTECICFLFGLNRVSSRVHMSKP